EGEDASEHERRDDVRDRVRDEAGLAHRDLDLDLRELRAELVEDDLHLLGHAYRVRPGFLEQQQADGLTTAVARDGLALLESVLHPGDILDPQQARLARLPGGRVGVVTRAGR